MNGMTIRRRAVMLAANNGLSMLTDGVYSPDGAYRSYDYTIEHNEVSVFKAGAVEANMVACPFSPAISVASGDTVSIKFTLERDSNSWTSRKCNIFLGATDDTRLSLCDETIDDLNSFVVSNTASSALEINSINIRFRSQGVSYNPALIFSIQILVNGNRRL